MVETQPNPIDPILHGAGKTAGMVVDTGMLVMCGVVVLAILGSAIYLVFRFYNRKISGDYIPKDDVLAYVREHHRAVLRPKAEERPSLALHRVFSIATTEIRRAEAADTTHAVRDLTVWTLRAYRDAFAELIEAAYAHKEGFDAFWSTPDVFKAKVSHVVTEIDAAIRCRLVDEFKMPLAFYNGWLTYRGDHDRLMDDMLDLAADKETPYDRVSSVLDSLFAKATSFQRLVQGFAHRSPSPAYTTPAAADDMVTHQRGFAAAGRSMPASSLFDRRRR